jgi:quinol monooxygenase YgiN
MSKFVQIIEFRTNRVDELQALADEMRAVPGSQGSALRGTVAQDRDRPGWYFNIVEFDSYESAMANSNRPEVSAFAARMAALCEETPRFYNLEVKQAWTAGNSTTTKAAVATAATALAGAAVTGLTKARQRVQERRAQRPGAATTTTTPRSQTPPPRVVVDSEGETTTDGDYGTPPPSSTI